MGRTVCRSRRGEDHAPLPSSTATDPGTRISCSTGSWRHSLHRSSAPARNSNSGASDAVVLSRLAGLPGVSVLSESEMVKYYQLQRVPRDANACAVVVITARWTKLRRTSGDLKDLDKVGIDLETSSAAMAFAPLPVDSVVIVLRAPMETLNSPSKAGSRNPPPLPSPQLSHIFSNHCRLFW